MKYLELALILSCSQWPSTIAEFNIFDTEDASFWERKLGTSNRMLRRIPKKVKDDSFFWYRELGISSHHRKVLQEQTEHFDRELGSSSHHRKIEQESNGLWDRELGSSSHQRALEQEIFWDRELSMSSNHRTLEQERAGFWDRELGKSSHKRALEQESNTFFWDRELGKSSHRRTLEKEQREIEEDTKFWRGERKSRSDQNKDIASPENDVDVKQNVKESIDKSRKYQEVEQAKILTDENDVHKSKDATHKTTAAIESSFWELFGNEVLEMHQIQNPNRPKLLLR